ncbi:hypothetical protein K227x_45210 [Rubripirellula lacrimiformis]|uniref:Ice-binding protein C-terminal domain-containing protein n=1 Tax=Rubripirellula lacrimiformis TaxID=1930273 RepID=A0A517NG57_9BACT|nr:PEP-CTERM sorting domain-containing protein [Rubripirellula lacrimiformis]QDT06114.1 hypothetical protein K227x_45210 [Rubripirellula lacrimiformis]
MYRMNAVCGLILALLTTCGERAESAVITFGIFGGDSPSTVSALVGSNPDVVSSVLTDLTATSLAGVDVVWAFNNDNFGQLDGLMDNSTAISSFVMNGGGLIYHDRRVTGAGAVGANRVLPGDGFSTTRDPDSLAAEDINIAPGASGPAVDMLTNASLDNGNESSHGYATLASLPSGSTPFLTRADDTHIVDFQYAFGDGFVYYSTIPLDAKFSSGAAPFDTLYASNVVNFSVQAVAVPEPSSMALALCGSVGFVMAVRRRRKTAA